MTLGLPSRSPPIHEPKRIGDIVERQPAPVCRAQRAIELAQVARQRLPQRLLEDQQAAAHLVERRRPHAADLVGLPAGGDLAAQRPDHALALVDGQVGPILLAPAHARCGRTSGAACGGRSRSGARSAPARSAATHTASRRSAGVRPAGDQAAERLVARSALGRTIGRLLIGAAPARCGDAARRCWPGSGNARRRARPAARPRPASRRALGVSVVEVVAARRRGALLASARTRSTSSKSALPFPRAQRLARAARRAAAHRRAAACADRPTWRIGTCACRRRIAAEMAMGAQIVSAWRHGTALQRRDPALTTSAAAAAIPSCSGPWRPAPGGRRHPDAHALRAGSCRRRRGTAVIVCPGGGYRNLSMDHEGTTGRRVPQQPRRHGLRPALSARPALPPSRDALRMRSARIRYVRAHADDTAARDRLGIMGFSAGGHLASTAATHFDAATPPPPIRSTRRAPGPTSSSSPIP